MEVYKQLLVWLSVLFIVGAFLNIFVSPFVDINDYSGSDSQTDLLNSIGGENSSNLLTSSTNTSFITEQIGLFNLIPSAITIPFFIIGLLLLILTLLNLIPFVG